MQKSCLAATLVFASLSGISLAQSDSVTHRLTEEKYHELLAELQPGDEACLTIPWKTKMLDAQNTASREGKPMFIWSMDGHPLGCT